jgi:2-phosphosulfolactate phosphatase
LVLPSPNGATLSTRVTSAVVLIGCLRNATAVAEHANRAGQRICVLAAGERTAGALRFALEDLLGAGAVIASLQGRRTPEAEYACAQYRPFRAILDAAIRLTPSGLELIARGFDADVGLAAELDVSAVVPELFDGSFSDHHLVDRCVNN